MFMERIMVFSCREANSYYSSIIPSWLRENADGDVGFDLNKLGDSCSQSIPI